MTTDEKMAIDERRKYLQRIRKRYVKATRWERSQILDGMMHLGSHAQQLNKLSRYSGLHYTTSNVCCQAALL